MRKVAIVDLPLHGGKAPPWLISRMKRLGKAIITVILKEFSYRELLRRLADPLWFQSLSYVLGYDWDSSGTTTVLTGVLREILSPDMGILVAGGKGKKALNTPNDIIKIGQIFHFSEKKIQELLRISRLVAKVDNALIQDEHALYHHAMFISKDGSWTIIQQGMNPRLKTARRYHWLSEIIQSFTLDPHYGILGNLKLPFVLNMATKESIEAQEVSLDLVRDGIRTIKRDLERLISTTTRIKKLTSFFGEEKEENVILRKIKPIHIRLLPTKINWTALERAYEIQPKTYEEFILLRGIGPGTIRALALIAELIYDAKLCWKDPIRYTFAVGGKDGVPYSVNIRRMEKVAEFLERAIEEARIGKTEKIIMLKKLSKLLGRTNDQT